MCSVAKRRRGLRDIPQIALRVAQKYAIGQPQLETDLKFGAGVRAAANQQRVALMPVDPGTQLLLLQTARQCCVARASNCNRRPAKLQSDKPGSAFWSRVCASRFSPVNRTTWERRAQLNRTRRARSRAGQTSRRNCMRLNWRWRATAQPRAELVRFARPVAASVRPDRSRPQTACRWACRRDSSRRVR